MCSGQKRKNTNAEQKRKHTNPCQSRELNPGNLEPQSGEFTEHIDYSQAL